MSLEPALSVVSTSALVPASSNREQNPHNCDSEYHPPNEMRMERGEYRGTHDQNDCDHVYPLAESRVVTQMAGPMLHRLAEHDKHHCTAW